MRRLMSEAYSNLIHAKLRSLLTLLGVLIGTASVVALVSSGQLATQHALEQFKNLGTDLFAISISPSSGSGSSTPGAQLALSDIPTLKKSSSAIVDIAPYTNYYASVSYEGTAIDATIIGATAALQNIVKIQVASGRFISDLDKNEFYCVIGSDIAEKLKDAGNLNPIGSQIRAGNYIYTIVGIIKPWPENIFMFADLNSSLILPIQNSFLLSKYVQIQNIVFKLSPNANTDLVQQNVTDAINQIVPGQQIFPRSAKQLIVSMEKQRQTLTLLLSLIGGVSLVVGGIGVMNIMLVSVTERRREIGIRMALGATGRDIGLMFITEAVALTILGGLIGIVLGVAISFAAAKLSHWEFKFYMLPPLIGFLVSVLVGIFFGFYPAHQASKLDPIQTLRSE